MELNPLLTVRSAQLGALSSAVGIELGVASNVLLLDESILGGRLVAAISGDAQKLAFTSPIEDRERAAIWVRQLEADLTSNQALSKVLSAGLAGDFELEVQTTPAKGADVALRVMGQRSTEQDIAAAVAAGIPDAVCTELGELVDKMFSMGTNVGAFAVRTGDDGREVELGRVMPDDADALTKLVALGERVGATKPQLGLVQKIHSLLAKGKGMSSTLTATPDGVSKRLSLRYMNPSLDLVLQLADSLYRGDTAKKLGTFAGAVAADQLAWIDLLLGPAEPPGLWIAAAVSHAYGDAGANQRA
jgi:hypothetical protein